MNENHVVATPIQKPFWKRGGLTRLSLIALVLSILGVADEIVRANGNLKVVIYPLVTNDAFGIRAILGWSSCILVPLTFTAVIYFVFENRVNPENYPEKYHLELLITIISVTFIGAVVIHGLLGGDTLTHKHQARFSGDIYNLAGFNTWDDLGYGSYMLYRCADSIFICTLVYESEGGYSIAYDQAVLVANKNTNTLSILINGETIYTHIPE